MSSSVHWLQVYQGARTTADHALRSSSCRSSCRASTAASSSARETSELPLFTAALFEPILVG